MLLFERHAAAAVALAAELKAALGSPELRALRPKYVSFKLYFMAVKASR